MKLLTNSADPTAQLGVVERSAYMSGNIGIAFINTVVASFIMFYYTDVLLLNAGIIGTIILVSRLLDGVTDILMGFIVDRTYSKHGNARVWIIRACVPFAISGILLVTVPAGSTELIQYIYVFITYNLFNSIFLTALYVPFNALVVNITSNPYERGLLGIFAMMGAGIGTMLVQSTIDAATKALGGDTTAWQIVIAIYALCGLIGHLICFYFTRERSGETPESLKNKQKVEVKPVLKALFTNQYWLIAIGVVFLALFATSMLGGSGMYYAKGLLGDTSYYASFANAITIAQLLTLITSFIFIKKYGKRNTMLAGMAILTVASLLQGLIGDTLALIIFFSALKGVGAGVAAGSVYGLVADTIDYGEWKSGIKSEGVGMAALTFATKVAQGFSVVLIGWLIELGQYDPIAVLQSQSALMAINISHNYIPMLCGALACLLLWFYKLDKIYPEIQEELAERRLQAKNER
ncbi:MFS transporter [uncultured Planococcus sp.]|uniref:MFS transporter n=1 Tax=uncultured Planococcus sp. TaxID=337815 RepID=UPI002623A5A1|nr:MFS transporter [uncultured Planococcus sp.]